MPNIGIVFSSKLREINLEKQMGKKYPVYLRFFDFFKNEGWNVFILTRKTYLGGGIFNGGYFYKGEGRFNLLLKQIKINSIYDRSGGVKFPPAEEPDLPVVNIRAFKIFCWDKWQAYLRLKKYMPKTFWVGKEENLSRVLPKIKTKIVVLKPFNGLKGLGVFIGDKREALNFRFLEKYPLYIAQHFVDTSAGIPGLVKGLHDLRVVIVNKKIVWSHIRTPPAGSLKANVAGGGEIKEIDCKKIPLTVRNICLKIAEDFYEEFDNPVFSVDFGLENNKPFIFELNDQIGFPRWEMKARDYFLKELVKRLIF